jgi:AcrR family transcriptional regulator
MSRPKNADGQRTRQAILDAALDLFAEKGFFGTSLRDLASAVGVRESALYNYFPSKDALFDALIVTDHEEKAERLSALAEVPIGDGRVALEQFTVAMLENFARPRQEQLFRILMSDGLRLAKIGRLNLLERLGNDGRGPVHGLLRRLIRTGVLRDGDLTMMVVSFVSPLIVWRQLRAINPESPIVLAPQEFAHQHVQQFLRGAAAPVAVATTRGRRLREATPRTTDVRRTQRLL